MKIIINTSLSAPRIPAAMPPRAPGSPLRPTPASQKQPDRLAAMMKRAQAARKRALDRRKVADQRYVANRNMLKQLMEELFAPGTDLLTGKAPTESTVRLAQEWAAKVTSITGATPVRAYNFFGAAPVRSVFGPYGTAFRNFMAATQTAMGRRVVGTGPMKILKETMSGASMTARSKKALALLYLFSRSAPPSASTEVTNNVATFLAAALRTLNPKADAKLAKALQDMGLLATPVLQAALPAMLPHTRTMAQSALRIKTSGKGAIDSEAVALPKSVAAFNKLTIAQRLHVVRDPAFVEILGAWLSKNYDVFTGENAPIFLIAPAAIRALMLKCNILELDDDQFDAYLYISKGKAPATPERPANFKWSSSTLARVLQIYPTFAKHKTLVSNLPSVLKPRYFQHALSQTKLATGLFGKVTDKHRAMNGLDRAKDSFIEMPKEMLAEVKAWDMSQQITPLLTKLVSGTIKAKRMSFEERKPTKDDHDFLMSHVTTDGRHRVSEFEIVEVYEVSSKSASDEARAKWPRGAKVIRDVFHGTSVSSASCIALTGFTIRKDNIAAGRSMGDVLYVAPNCDKSMQYFGKSDGSSGFSRGKSRGVLFVGDIVVAGAAVERLRGGGAAPFSWTHTQRFKTEEAGVRDPSVQFIVRAVYVLDVAFISPRAVAGPNAKTLRGKSSGRFKAPIAAKSYKL